MRHLMDKEDCVLYPWPKWVVWSSYQRLGFESCLHWPLGLSSLPKSDLMGDESVIMLADSQYGTFRLQGKKARIVRMLV